ncbi:hypothetical protein ACFVZE_09325 [Streptomyces anulatus]
MSTPRSDRRTGGVHRQQVVLRPRQCVHHRDTQHDGTSPETLRRAAA